MRVGRTLTDVSSWMQLPVPPSTCSRFRVCGLGFRVQGLAFDRQIFKVWGFAFRGEHLKEREMFVDRCNAWIECGLLRLSSGHSSVRLGGAAARGNCYAFKNN